MDLLARAAAHAALGEPIRLAVVDELHNSDRSPVELARRLGIAGNLLAHHLDALERSGLVTRNRSSGDGRRRYVHLEHDVVTQLVHIEPRATARALFVCTANSARSQLAAALYAAATGTAAGSAGTHPASTVHPGAVAAARRAGVSLRGRRPVGLDELGELPPLVVTVCDRVHEELDAPADWLHWSIPDPVPAATAAAFDGVVAELGRRIDTLTGATAP